ncbi:MAG: MFS transporter, partial [Puniceicoccaceae bacterium]
MSKEEPIPQKERVPFKEKVAFAMGGIGVGIQQSADNGIMTPIFVLGVGISPVWMSAKAVIERIYDAFTDIFMGWLSDNTRTKWGRRRPYMLLGAILMGLAMPLMFFFDRDWSVPAVTVWMIICGLILTTTYTIYNIPRNALFLELTPNSNERTNVAVIGAYLGMSVQFLVAWMWKLTQLPIFADELGNVDMLNGARWINLLLAGVIILFGLMPVFFCKERYYHQASGQKKESLLASMKLTFKNKPFLFLVMTGLFYVLGLNIKWGLDFYTKVYYIFDGDQEAAATLAGIQGTGQIFLSLAGVRFFQWLSAVRGKRFALNVAVSMVAIGSASTLFLYIPSLPYLSMIPICI